MKKILVANRGEIALRVMRTCKKMGIATVAVYSTADRKSPHVRFADEAVCIGEPASKQSYLDIDKIIKVCKQLNVDGVHPGYGFLSENAQFAKACEENGIVFIGPSVLAIEVMGSKLAAKQAVGKYNVPLVPGTDQPITDIAEAKKLAAEIGFPILIKASAGGGGKGMRVVENEAEFEEQMNLAVSEAVSAFGDGAVFIEKFVQSPRHIEIQVLGDAHGNVVYLFERECSVQRRHQKVVEEAPSALLTPEVRKKMGEAAVNVAKAVNYVGAGTVEFIANNNLDFYFLEMNTRLQVEHPVTEMITGKDLVKEQIQIAEGKPLSFSQEDLKINGHSIELRVYAEDPNNNFLPDIGTLDTYQVPTGDGVRVDDGFDEGMEIPIYYDPMIAKLIAHAENRDAAIQKLLNAIDDYKIEGVKTTLGFGKFVLNHPAFISGDFDTKFVDNYFHPTNINQKELKMASIMAASLYAQFNKK
ncbi:MAG TPA: acetyl-CoA carboxylase biotin carboxylase subunit [Chitinophagales bacterium]|nr:acetyl-CoA carboxylase biotin carboxylase subunit [Chitinophagales bacterium]HMU97706.1 acetyl-CoA carboxylase biotin carboxylase subunit [Chitinophagales bacterium]HMV02503.1 acetyl-CoA carboxylase biotin carboxylase subunit [Chitinophagales bacterium]HMW94588.1 acetyl-CoA carboxylase biotin carboxylase subunit [Chitinophagales bacterium]HMY42427.1 acetyl-CoA carboxylase biotin carboxylase subunit [Chitinophagales bacterium]